MEEKQRNDHERQTDRREGEDDTDPLLRAAITEEAFNVKDNREEQNGHSRGHDHELSEDSRAELRPEPLASFRWDRK